jgi:AraC-like DNA-binding protein
MNKKKKEKEKIEFRYYAIPQNEPVLALLGNKWIQCYGQNVDGLHFHNLLEIGYCYWGNGQLILDETSYRFSGDMISIIPKNFPHTTKSDSNTIAKWEYIYIDIESFLYSLYDKNSIFVEHLIHRINKKAYFIDSYQNELLAQQVQSILEEMRFQRELYVESVQGLLFTLLLQIARMDPYISNTMKPSQTKVSQIQHALDYVKDHYFTNIPIETLAEACHISETHFRRLFGTTMNMSPVEYINLVRVEKACELMKKNQDSMADIAVKVGFQTVSTFNRNFKKIFGVSPYQWKVHPDNYEGKLLNHKILVREGW